MLFRSHVLVNMVSRRVRQLNTGHGDLSRPMIANSDHLHAADIALLEIIEDKLGFDMPEIIKLTRPTGRNRNRPQGWAKFEDAKANGDHEATRRAA